MEKNDKIVALDQGQFHDALTEIAREGARRVLAEALTAEVDAFIEAHIEKRLADGRQRVVRHGGALLRQCGVAAWMAFLSLGPGQPGGRIRLPRSPVAPPTGGDIMPFLTAMITGNPSRARA